MNASTVHKLLITLKEYCFCGALVSISWPHQWANGHLLRTFVKENTALHCTNSKMQQNELPKTTCCALPKGGSVALE